MEFFELWSYLDVSYPEFLRAWAREVRMHKERDTRCEERAVCEDYYRFAIDIKASADPQSVWNAKHAFLREKHRGKRWDGEYYNCAAYVLHERLKYHDVAE